MNKMDILRYLENFFNKPLKIVYPLKNIIRKKILSEKQKTLKNIIINYLLDDPIKVNTPKTPLWVGVEINNICNLNCLMCNTQLSKRTKGNINLEDFESSIKQFKEMGIKIIPFHTIGEPLLYRDLNSLFKILRKYKMKVALSTNGQISKQLKSIIIDFKDCIYFLRFSIDGAIPETYEYIRKGAKYERLIESLELVNDLNQNKTNLYVHIKIDSILNMTNIYEIPLFFSKYSKYCWPEDINFHLITGLSPDSNYFRETFPFPNLIKSNVPCNLVFNTIYVTFDGNLTLCCRDYDGELIVGNIHENSIINVFHGKNAEEIRKQHINKSDLKINVCKECYGPYNFAADIVNEYIHYSYQKNPSLTPKEFGENILKFLTDLNKILETKDKKALEDMILRYFDINSK